MKRSSLIYLFFTLFFLLKTTFAASNSKYIDHRGLVPKLCFLDSDEPDERYKHFLSNGYGPIYPCDGHGTAYKSHDSKPVMIEPIGNPDDKFQLFTQPGKNYKDKLSGKAQAVSFHSVGDASKVYYAVDSIKIKNYTNEKGEKKDTFFYKVVPIDSSPNNQSRRDFMHLDTTKNDSATDPRGGWVPESQFNIFPAHNLPPRVYLDGVPGTTVQIFSKPFLNFKNRPSAEDGYAWPKVGDDSVDKPQYQYFVKGTRLKTDYLDPLTGEIGERVFYNIDQVPADQVQKYLSNEKVTGVISGWVDSNYIRSTRLTNVPDKLPTVEDIKKQTETVAGQACTDCYKEKEPKPLPDVLEPEVISSSSIINTIKKNQCLGTPPNVRKTNMVGDLEARLAPKIKAYNAKDQLKLKAIDVLARTIYGEIRDCHALYGERYSKAQARIFLNRAELCMVGKCEFASPTDSLKKKSLPEAILGVLKYPFASSAWQSSDPNVKKMFCVRKEDTALWEQIVDVAAETVLQTGQFKYETRTIPFNAYFGMPKESKPKFLRSQDIVTNIRIDGYPVDRYSRCIALYTSPKVAEPAGRDAYLREQIFRQDLHALSIGTVAQCAVGGIIP